MAARHSNTKSKKKNFTVGRMGCQKRKGVEQERTNWAGGLIDGKNSKRNRKAKTFFVFTTTYIQSQKN